VTRDAFKVVRASGASVEIQVPAHGHPYPFSVTLLRDEVSAIDIAMTNAFNEEVRAQVRGRKKP
jgi:hypothetical protein